MNRKELQKLSRVRLKEANRLLKAKEFSGAYYLAGIAVECALKACIAKKTQEHDFPDKQHAIKCYEHDPMKLVGVAGLGADLSRECSSSPQFDSQWAIVAKWKVDSRYEFTQPHKAKALYSAIASTKHGVLKWLRQHW